jgi:hypothetical protein
MSLTDFLNLSRTESGIAAVLGIVLSFLLELWPQFDGLDTRVKRLTVMVICFVLPTAATFALYGWGASPDQLWAGLFAGGAAFLGSQVGHLPALGKT